MNCGLAKICSVHRYAMPWTFYFGWICRTIENIEQVWSHVKFRDFQIIMTWENWNVPFVKQPFMRLMYFVNSPNWLLLRTAKRWRFKNVHIACRNDATKSDLSATFWKQPIGYSNQDPATWLGGLCAGMMVCPEVSVRGGSCAGRKVYREDSVLGG